MAYKFNHLKLLHVLSFAIFILSSCQQKQSNKLYRIELKLNENRVVSYLELYSKKAILHNGAEPIELTRINKSENIELIFPFFESKYILSPNKSIGSWIRDYKGKLKAVEIKLSKLNQLPNFNQKVLNTMNWRLEDDSILKLQEHETNYTGTVLTKYGDYRYLYSEDKTTPIRLYGHDGAFALQVQLKDTNPITSVNILSSDSYHKKFLARSTDNLLIESDTKIIDEKLVFSKKDLNGEIINLDKIKGIKLIQIFGSWCPNCIDEAKFIKELYPDGEFPFSFITLAFERTYDDEKAKLSIKKVKKHFGFKHPFILMSSDPESKPWQELNLKTKISTFPSLIILNSHNKIIDLHSGFSGPATGESFNQYKREFKLKIEKLMGFSQQ